MEIRQWKPGRSMGTNRRTDEHDENSRFSQSCERV